MMYKDFYMYQVYENGAVYSCYTHKFLKGDITKQGYLQYTLFINKEKFRIKAHRLVAFLFLDTPENFRNLVINHKDGNKLNNHYTNLEWCTTDYNNYHARINGLNNISKSNSERWKDPEFREKTSKHFSEIRKNSGMEAGENNGRFRYLIYDKDGTKYSRTELSELLKLSQSYTDALIKKAANGHSNEHFEKYGIYVKDVDGKVNRLSKPLAVRNTLHGKEVEYIAT